VDEALRGKRMSRSASKPDSASLNQWKWPVRRIWMKPAIDGESNGRTQPSDFPGSLGTARADRSAEEPGRPATPKFSGAGVGRPIVAGKRVTTVERRGRK
jgi:hypothetical protein